MRPKGAVEGNVSEGFLREPFKDLNLIEGE